VGVEEELCPAASYRVGTACLTASAVQPLPLTLSRESVVGGSFFEWSKMVPFAALVLFENACASREGLSVSGMPVLGDALSSW
jgi:hypothetical protein